MVYSLVDVREVLGTRIRVLRERRVPDGPSGAGGDWLVRLAGVQALWAGRVLFRGHVKFSNMFVCLCDERKSNFRLFTVKEAG